MVPFLTPLVLRTRYQTKRTSAPEATALPLELSGPVCLRFHSWKRQCLEKDCYIEIASNDCHNTGITKNVRNNVQHKKRNIHQPFHHTKNGKTLIF